MQSHQLEITNRKGYKLNAYLDLPPNQKPNYYAVFAHCFTCNSNLNAVRHISTALTVHGIGVIRFDFTGLGKSEGTFAESHFSANVTDLLDVYTFIKSRYMAPELLIGHSLGGAAVIAAAGHLPELRLLVTIGAPSKVDHVKKILSRSSAPGAGDADWDVNIGGRPFRINNAFLDELDKTDLQSTLKSNRKPVLFMHSPEDQIVTIDNAHALYASARHPKSFISLDDADHLLSDKKDSVYTANIMAVWASRYLTAEVHQMPDTRGEQVLGFLNSEDNKFTTTLQTAHHAFIADEPAEVGGEDLGPSPYDYLSAALAACTTMTLRLYAQRKGWDLKEVYVYITYGQKHTEDMVVASGNPGHLEHFSKKLHFVGNLDQIQKERLREIAARCPVHQTLSMPVHIETTNIN